MYPTKFTHLIELLEELPGVGNKTATRYAFSILNKNLSYRQDFIDSINGLNSIKKCKCCGFLSDEDECLICKDNTRNNDTIVVVAYPSDVVAMESIEEYKGKYHVLNGLISSSKGIYPEDINIESLFERLDNVKEVILALPSTMEGEITSLYLEKLLKEYKVSVSKLASGIPMGTSLEYADNLTLSKALNNRVKVGGNNEK